MVIVMLDKIVGSFKVAKSTAIGALTGATVLGIISVKKNFADKNDTKNTLNFLAKLHATLIEFDGFVMRCYHGAFNKVNTEELATPGAVEDLFDQLEFIWKNDVTIADIFESPSDGSIIKTIDDTKIH